MTPPCRENSARNSSRSGATCVAYATGAGGSPPTGASARVPETSPRRRITTTSRARETKASCLRTPGHSWVTSPVVKSQLRS
nr:hypothetical protein [Microbispora sp. H10836]